MKSISIALLLLIFTIIGNAQNIKDSLFEYSKIISLEGKSKEDIYDKSLIWCSKAFENSNYSIKVKERESGIISGKALSNVSYVYYRPWKTPSKKFPNGTKRQEIGLNYNHYYFDWLIQIRDNKLKFSISNVKFGESGIENTDKYFLKKYDSIPPYLALWNKEVSILSFQASRKQFEADLDILISNLVDEINSIKNDW
jgi:hypothetical protein